MSSPIARIPSTAQRVAFATTIATATFALVFASNLRGSGRTDFSLIWFGANALLHGANPFVLVGPGRVFDLEWGALYPATAYVLGIPFAFFPEHIASALFASLSAFALAYGSTRGSWHHVPMFASVAFLSAAHLAQWSILFTAALFIPALCIAFPAKPQLAIAILAATRTRGIIIGASASLIGLASISLALVPGWPSEWIALVRDAHQLVPPIFLPGGFLLVAVLLRWRRPEAWLVAFIATMPSTAYPYNVLPLLAIAATYHEASFLSLTSSFGALVAIFLTDAVGGAVALEAASASRIALCYLPAAGLVLTRPNINPAWTGRELIRNPLRPRQLAESRVRGAHQRIERT